MFLLRIFHLFSPGQIFASKKVLYAGQAVGLILATSKEAAAEAVKLVKIEYENVRNPVVHLSESILAAEIKAESAGKAADTDSDVKIGMGRIFGLVLIL